MVPPTVQLPLAGRACSSGDRTHDAPLAAISEAIKLQVGLVPWDWEPVKSMVHHSHPWSVLLRLKGLSSVRPGYCKSRCSRTHTDLLLLLRADDAGHALDALGAAVLLQHAHVALKVCLRAFTQGRRASGRRSYLQERSSRGIHRITSSLYQAGTSRHQVTALPEIACPSGITDVSSGS